MSLVCRGEHLRWISEQWTKVTCWLLSHLRHLLECKLSIGLMCYYLPWVRWPLSWWLRWHPLLQLSDTLSPRSRESCVYTRTSSGAFSRKLSCAKENVPSFLPSVSAFMLYAFFSPLSSPLVAFSSSLSLPLRDECQVKKSNHTHAALTYAHTSTQHAVQ